MHTIYFSLKGVKSFNIDVKYLYIAIYHNHTMIGNVLPMFKSIMTVAVDLVVVLFMSTLLKGAYTNQSIWSPLA